MCHQNYCKLSGTFYAGETLILYRANIRFRVPPGSNLNFSLITVIVGAFNQEKALVGAFSVIVKTGCGTDGSIVELHLSCPDDGSPETNDDSRDVEEVGVGPQELGDILGVRHPGYDHGNPRT